MSSNNIEFSDGVSFNTDGQYRLTRRSDGWYVVGHGLLLPVNDQSEGYKVIEEMTELQKLKRTEPK